jgi:hypothetical protein
MKLTMDANPRSFLGKSTESLELVVIGETWNTSARYLIENLGAFAVGKIRRQRTECGERLVVTLLSTTMDLPRGASIPDHDGFVVFFMEYAGQRLGLSARELVHRIGPKASQVVAAVVIYPGEPETWDAVACFGQRTVKLDGIRHVGAGMHHIQRQPIHEQLPDRWSRTTGAVGERTVRRSRSSTVTFVGVGRNGSQAAFQFAAVGTGHERLIDHDLIESHNLDAMVGLQAADIGYKKVARVAKRIRLFRPDLRVSCLAASITEPAIYAGLRRMHHDLIVSAVDNDEARLATSRLAQETLSCHLDIGTIVRRTHAEELFAGDARLLLPGQGCVACVGGLQDFSEARYRLEAPAGALKRGLQRHWQERRSGSLVTLNEMTVATGLQLWLDLLAGKLSTSFWSRLRWVPGRGLLAHGAPVGGAATCEVCGTIGSSAQD